MRIRLIFLIMSLAGCQLHAQAGGLKLFGTDAAPADIDSVNESGTTLESRTILFDQYTKLKGSPTIYGYVLKKAAITKAGQTITPKVRLIKSDKSLGPYHRLTKISIDSTGTAIEGQSTIIASADTTWYEIALARESWWTYSRGLKLYYEASSAATNKRSNIQGKLDYK